MSKKPNKYGYDGSPEFKPLSPWAYFGYNLLFAIPIVGFICNLVFCFADGNRNRKNYARSIWVSSLFVLIFSVVVIVVLSIAIKSGNGGQLELLVDKIKDLVADSKML